MAQTMTPSCMTLSQVDRAVEIFRAQLMKHRQELPSKAVQKVFGQRELGRAWLEVLRCRVEAITNLIVRRVRVNRSRTFQDALAATGRNLYTDDKVVESIPPGSGEEIDVYFFKLDRSTSEGWISDDDLAKEYELRGLVPDPIAQVQVNIDDPAFADTHPNITLWKDAQNRRCVAVFDQYYNVPALYIDSYVDDWSDSCWFGGVRKHR